MSWRLSHTLKLLSATLLLLALSSGLVVCDMPLISEATYRPGKLSSERIQALPKISRRPAGISDSGKEKYYNSVPASSNHVQKGEASWYGPNFHGRKTANGEQYNMYAYTAAHRTLPFETFIRVTNLANNKSVVLRVNDRGPYGAARRIIDLSYAAAQELKIVRKGKTKVRLEVLGYPSDYTDFVSKADVLNAVHPMIHP